MVGSSGRCLLNFLRNHQNVFHFGNVKFYTIFLEWALVIPIFQQNSPFHVSCQIFGIRLFIILSQYLLVSEEPVVLSPLSFLILVICVFSPGPGARGFTDLLSKLLVSLLFHYFSFLYFFDSLYFLSHAYSVFAFSSWRYKLNGRL